MMAVACATGISHGTAHTIGALLFEEIGGFTLHHMRRIRFRALRPISGVDCIAVSGLHPAGGRITAWFGTEDLLLRRLLHAKFKEEELRFGVTPSFQGSTDLFKAPEIDA
jgi:hypothetical protein